MFASKFLVPTLAVFGLAAAQSASICSQPTATISNAADATALAQCTTVETVFIATSVVGGIALDGIKQIKGGLIATDASNLTSISASTVNSIGGAFQLTRLTTLSSLSFPLLASVGSISWITLPNVQQLSFSHGITKASSVFITDTALTSLDGINLMTVGSMEITNNGALRKIDTQLANSTGGITISANGLNLNLTFPKLTSALNMTVRNISSLSIPALQTVNGTFGVYSSSMESIMAPNLTSVNGDFAFIADLSLTNISCPSLTTIGGGLLIANNTNLLSIDGFPKLATTGAINLTGNFTNAVLPSLADVKGTFNAQSSGNFSCAPFDADQKNQVVKGQYHCTAKSNNVQSSVGSGDTSGSGTTSGAPAATSSKGAAANIKPDSVLPIFALTALVGCFVTMGGLVHMSL